MKKILLSVLIFTGSFLHLKAQIFTPTGAIGGATIAAGNYFVGIGTSTPSARLEISGTHGDSRLLLHANGNGNPDTYHADLTLWASEPGLSWSGVGIGNNIHNFKTGIGGLNLLNTARGGSYIRLLDNAMLFNVVSIYGVDKQALSIDGNGNLGIGTTNPTAKLEVNGAIYSNANILSDSFGGFSGGDTELTTNTGGAANLKFKTQMIERMRINASGNVGIGTTIPDEKLTVKGKIHTQEVRVDLIGYGPDYVFEKYYTGKSELKSNYVMPSLAEIESFTKKNHHLPNVPSAQEIKQNGLSLGEMSNVLLQKVEELTLYAIEQQKKLEEQNKTIEVQSKMLEALSMRLNSLEKK